MEKGRQPIPFRIYALGVTIKKCVKKPKALESPKPPAAGQIAELADRSVDVAHFFTGKGKLMPPILPAKAKPNVLYEI
jgi:hypothetical protein